MFILTSRCSYTTLRINKKLSNEKEFNSKLCLTYPAVAYSLDVGALSGLRKLKRFKKAIKTKKACKLLAYRQVLSFNIYNSGDAGIEPDKQLPIECL